MTAGRRQATRHVLGLCVKPLVLRLPRLNPDTLPLECLRTIIT